MSKGSRKRRKARLAQQAADPKWAAIQNLLALYSLKVERFQGGYLITKIIGSVYPNYDIISEDAPLEEWITTCTNIDRGQQTTWSSSILRAAKQSNFWSGKHGKLHNLSKTAPAGESKRFIFFEESAQIQQADYFAGRRKSGQRRHGPQEPYRLSQNNRPPRTLCRK